MCLQEKSYLPKGQKAYNWSESKICCTASDDKALFSKGDLQLIYTFWEDLSGP